jgi:hypothetical protein
MKKSFLSFIAVIVAITSFSQTDFSGTWIFKEKRHVSGPQYANELPKQIKVQQTKDSLIIENTSAGNGGVDVTNRIVFAMNGKLTMALSGNSSRKRKLAWSEDKKSITLTTIFYKESGDDIDLTRVETWVIDGSQLKVNKKSIEANSENWETNGVFEKH